MIKADNLRAALPAVILPMLATVTVLAVLLGAVLHFSTSGSDAKALARQSRLVTVALEESASQIATDQEASTLWDDAVMRLRERPLDYRWLDNNMGTWFHDYYGHDEVYLLDPANGPVYAMQAGVRSAPRTFARVSSDILPLATRLRRTMQSGYVAGEGSEGQTVGAWDMTMVGGRPAIVSLKPVISESGDLAQEPGTEYLHASVRYLDGSFLVGLSRDVLIDAPLFSREPGNRAALPVRNRAGDTLGYITWAPFQPGKDVENRVIPAVVAALAIVAALLAWLLTRVWRSRIELEASRSQAQHLAFHDPLTGLPNRALFEDRLAHAMARRAAGSTAVVLLDLDRFKNVNDTLGHQAGDALIREFGARLAALVREGDTVARLGGDEFAVLLEKTGESEIASLCQRVLQAVGLPFEVVGSQAFVGASLGVALATRGDDTAEVVRRADIALYRAKADGRNTYRIFTPSMDDKVRLRGNIEEELRYALNTGKGLRVHYQPQFDDTGAVLGLEALVRWEHPTRGLISPEQFVPVAEETGLIVPLGDWVLREACRVSSRWPDLFVAVNLSPVQFRSSNLFERVLGIVLASGAEPDRIQFEITERVLMEGDDTVQEVLARLRGAGFTIVLDDFGTGYSSISYLRRVEVDKIKIDQSFVRYLGMADDSSQIVTAVLALGQALGVEVAAEGVETAEQRRFLAGAGCREMQGFLFSRPVAAEDLPGLLQAPGGEAGAA